jgi:hypothetical protein
LNVIGKKYGDTRKVLKQASDYLKPHKRLPVTGKAIPKAGATALHQIQSSSVKELKNH